MSVLDSGFMLGDGVWEGIHLHKGVLVFAKPHLRRLYEGAKAIGLELGVSPKQLLSMVSHNRYPSVNQPITKSGVNPSHLQTLIDIC